MSQGTRFVEGSLWAIGMRWAMRGAGLFSTLILARILTPEDFGLVAMSSLVLGLLSALSEMGTWQLLIRSGTRDPRDYNTAWTLMLIQSVLLAVVMFALAAPAAIWFNDPRLVAVIRVTSLGSIIMGFLNVGTVMFRRDLDFRSDFLFGFFSKVMTVIPTVVLALVLRNYWALVYGPLVGRLLEVLASYKMHPFRPRLGLHDWRRFLSFSIWIMPTSIANYLNKKIDVFIVGNVAGTAQLGIYNVASELSRMATGEIVTPMGRAIFPNLARLGNDRVALTHAFVTLQRAISMLSFAFGLATAAMAGDIVQLLLGSQWTAAVPLIAWLGVFAAFDSVLMITSSHILIVLRKEREMAILNWLRLVTCSGSVLAAAAFGTVVDIAMAATLSTGAVLTVVLIYIAAVMRLSVFVTLFGALRCFGVAVLAYAAAKWAHIGALPVVLSLIVDGTVYAVVLIAFHYFLWVIEGRPDGPERRVANLFQKAVQGFKVRHSTRS